MFSTPVLLIIFNRPKQTALMLNSLAARQPEVLYVAADGPRANNASDAVLCAETRALIEEKVTWKCEVKKLFLDENYGCGKAVSNAITWFFKHNEYGIILEDDCLPDPTFYGFCEQLLLKYRHDQKVMHIGGSNFQQGKKRGDADYYFSAEVHVWGWASWRRAWENYDFDMKELDAFVAQRKLANYYTDRTVINYWLGIFERMQKHEIDTWDYQWRYSIWNAGGIAIIPNTNLVSNIGFGADATHTFVSGPYDNMPTQPVGEKLVHPASKVINAEADKYTFDEHYKPEILTLSKKLYHLRRRIINKLKIYLR